MSSAKDAEDAEDAEARLPLAEVAGYAKAAKLGARVGRVHEKARAGGICLCINRREDQGTWGLAREDAPAKSALTEAFRRGITSMEM